jgi:hypothetical protein
MKRKKKLIKRIFIFYFIISLFLVSCNNKTIKNSLLENGWQQHKLVMNGKCISFILPEYYVSTDEFNDNMFAEAQNNDVEALYAFYSTKNNEDKFVITIQPKNQYATTIDSFFKHHFYTYIDCNMVPFFEKKRENNHVFYLIMTSKIDDFFCPKGTYIYSHFSYITILEEKLYFCSLTMYDPVDNSFSYEEKRKIIESVRIEDITKHNKTAVNNARKCNKGY